MARLVKIILVLAAAFVGVGLLASLALFLFFDPNDFRENISAGVKKATGRELVIEGDLSLSLFPWVAIEIGRTQLGNAEDFDDGPFLSFESARLSVRLMPLLTQGKLAVGTATLDSLNVNLHVNSDGVNNWDDFASANESPRNELVDDIINQRIAETENTPLVLDIANINISNANVSYSNEQLGSRSSITALSLKTGRITAGTPFDVEAEFSFESSPENMAGQLSINGTVLAGEGMAQIDITGLNISGTLQGLAEHATELNFDARAISIDTEGQNVTLGEMDLALLGVSLTADVKRFSYAGEITPKASVTVHEFSLKDLISTLGTAPPPTSDASALQRVSFSANVAVGRQAIALTDMQLLLDDTTISGTISLPRATAGTILFDLTADSIVLDHYMAPPLDPELEAAEVDVATIEIPVDLIRALHATGKITLGQATLSGVVFENLQLGMTSANGKLRLHPISAEIFDGAYKGDVRIDASGDEVAISVNENIVDVQLSSLANAMYGVENISGTINGSFALSGQGVDLDAIRRNLSGQISLKLADGAWLGTDVWYQLRKARATLKQEPLPEPRLPARTEFSAVSASGKVTNGILRNNDFLAELPFLRLSGAGSINFVEASLDYAMEARVLGSPEFAGTVTAGELKDFTSAVIPLKVSGQLASPSITPDVDALIRQQVEKKIRKETKKLKDRLLKSLLGGAAQPPDNGEETNGDAENTEENDEQAEPDPEDQIKDVLKKLFGS